MMPSLLSTTLLLSLVGSITCFSSTILTTPPPPRHQSSCNALGSRSSDPTAETAEGEGPSPQRRALLALALTAATLPLDIYGLDRYKKSQLDTSSSEEGSNGSSSIFVPISNVDEALTQIETSVDPRFLHAVVASDYRCFYREGTQLGLASQSSDKSGRSGVFDELERNELRDRPVRPGQSQLVVTNIDAARRRWGAKNVVSVWPLMEQKSIGSDGDSDSIIHHDHSGIHYAWPEDGGVFRADSNLIVDGIDCGRMSLEDALEGDMEVLVQANQFLVVPLAMEDALVGKLKGAFLM